MVLPDATPPKLRMILAMVYVLFDYRKTNYAILMFMGIRRDEPLMEVEDSVAMP